MLTLKAQVVNTYTAPTGKSKDGQEYGGEHKVQLQGINVLKNGEKRVELLTLTTSDVSVFEKAQGKIITVDIGAFSTKNGIQYFIPKHAKVQLDGQRKPV